MRSLFGLDPGSWTPHSLHASDRTYVETNCYADAVIELVAATGAEASAVVAGAAATDFEHDQFTFFKPAAEDLRLIAGIELRETQPVGSLATQVATRLASGETLMPEVDAWWLPDTAATSYRAEHVKTSVVVEAIDVDREIVRYFHNATYAEAGGADFRGLFGLDATPRPLPPYVDGVWLDHGAPLTGDPAREAARHLLAGHLVRRPASDPVARFGEQIATDLPDLLVGDLARFHEYAFATVRMLGSSAELLASHVRWLLGADGEPHAARLDEVVAGAKLLSFRLARRREFDVAGVVAPMATAWRDALDGLDEQVAR